MSPIHWTCFKMRQQFSMESCSWIYYNNEGRGNNAIEILGTQLEEVTFFMEGWKDWVDVTLGNI